MNKVILDEQSIAPFDFADKKTSTKDIVYTKRLLKKLYVYLAEFKEVETQPTSVSFLNKKKRNSRIIVYDFKKLLIQKNIFCVVFYGNKRENLSKEDTDTFFNTDWEIAMSMVSSTNILCYASQELSDGNWFNLVLFTKESDKLHVTAKEKHSYAAYTLAPKRFTWVRLHNAIIPNGIADFTMIKFTKSNYYNFDTMWFGQRFYEQNSVKDMV